MEHKTMFWPLRYGDNYNSLVVLGQITITGETKKIWSKGPAEIWTRILRFRVSGANRYTTGPYEWLQFSNPYVALFVFSQSMLRMFLSLLCTSWWLIISLCLQGVCISHCQQWIQDHTWICHSWNERANNVDKNKIVCLSSHSVKFCSLIGSFHMQFWCRCDHKQHR